MLFRMHIGRDTLVFDHIREIPRCLRLSETPVLRIMVMDADRA
jgi:hypothetical protein